jgi:hypothetical protein
VPGQSAVACILLLKKTVGARSVSLSRFIKMLDLSEQLTSDLNPAAVCNAWSETLTFEAPVTVDESDTELEVCVLHVSSSSYDMHVSSSSFEAPVTVDESDTELEVCVFFTAGPIIKLYAGVGPVRNPVL